MFHHGFHWSKLGFGRRFRFWFWTKVEVRVGVGVSVIVGFEPGVA